MSDKLLNEKMDEVQAKFDQVTAAASELQNQVNEGNKQLNLYREELVRIQGEYRVLVDLGATPKEQPQDVEVVEEAKKDKKK